jgi:hypothetical protein
MATTSSTPTPISFISQLPTRIMQSKNSRYVHVLPSKIKKGEFGWLRSAWSSKTWYVSTRLRTTRSVMKSTTSGEGASPPRAFLRSCAM